VSGGFEQLVDLEGLGPEDVSRLRRVHDLLVASGPPAELPAALSRPPADPDGAQVIAFEPRRRKPAALLLLAATVAAACFGGGYVLANQAHRNAIHVVRVVSLKGQHNSFASLASASLKVGSVDANGNWPIQLTVSGLPQPDNTRYYLMLWQNGKPTALCGIFRVGQNGATKVAFNVPYKITRSTRWVVTEMAPGLHYPGHVVMTTS
jgi:hypothetical protein